MEVIHLTNSSQLTQYQKNYVLAMGYFDGLHLGHQAVLDVARNIALEKQLAFAVMTFYPHPTTVLQGRTNIALTPLFEKKLLFENYGVETLFIIEFTKEFAQLSPEVFVHEYIISLNVKHAVAGFDFTFGYQGRGNMNQLFAFTEGKVAVTTVPEKQLDNRKISSTRIRNALKEGDCLKANRLLGRNYSTKGKVVTGEQRGKQIGFPTANLNISVDYELPQTGVYLVYILIDGKRYQGVCNIGYKPTFHEKADSQRPTVEVHILDFSADIYGKEGTVEWLQQIRREKKFTGVAELIEQINKDRELAIDYFKKQLY